MANVKTKDLPTAASIALTDSLVGNVDIAAVNTTAKTTLANIKTALGVSSAADPSGTIGLSAVNGVATTFLRSDGAPALSQSIVPTWTGQHTFTEDILLATTKGIASTNVALQLYDDEFRFTRGVSGSARARIYSGGGGGIFQTTSDGMYGFSSGGGFAAPDTAIGRTSAGILQINTGTVGSTSRITLDTGGTMSFISPGANFQVGNAGGACFLNSTTTAPIDLKTGGVQRVRIDDSNPNIKLGSSSDAGLARNAAGLVEVNTGTFNTFADLTLRQLLTDKTMTTAGTTGNVTINKGAGSVRFAAAATSLTLTNSLITTTTILAVSLSTNDATAMFLNYVTASGSVVFNLAVAPTAETELRWCILA